MAKNKGRSPGLGPEERAAAREKRARTVCMWAGFILLALAFMWTQSLREAYDSSMSAMDDEYAARTAALAGPDGARYDQFHHSGLPDGVDAGEVDLAAAVADVAGYQNEFSETVSDPLADVDAWEAKILASWEDMEQWFPNEFAHSWYSWDANRVSAGWTGYETQDAMGRPMGIWTCSTDDGTLLAYAMAWYSGNHMFGSWTSRVTNAGYGFQPVEEYDGDPLSGTYDAPGQSDGTDGRTVDEHVDSAMSLLEGLGMTHDWYDQMVREAQEARGAGGTEGGD